MRIKDYSHNMCWSIWTDDYEDGGPDPSAPDQEHREWYFNIRLDLGASSADGTWPVEVDDGVVVDGVVVKDGQFDLIPTLDALYKGQLIAADGPTDHVYVEALEWDPQNDRYKATFGS